MADAAKKKKILVIDDEPVVGMLLSELLSEAGYHVDSIADPVGALRQFEGISKYDLIMLDINMPKMDGITLFRNITIGFPELKNKFLFISGNITEEARSFLKGNNYPYITKPFRAADLLTHVNSLFSREEQGFFHEQGAVKGLTEDIIQEQADRRIEQRHPWSAYCQVFNKGKYNMMPLSAKTIDISQNGVKIRYIGEPLTSGEMVNLHIISLNLRGDASVKWSKNINDLNAISGLQLIEPMYLPPVLSRAHL